MTGKILSLIIAIVCLILAYLSGGGEILLQMFGILFFALALIWFSEEWGGYSGAFPPLSGVSQIHKSPPFLVNIFGWIFLIVVLVFAIIIALG